MQIAGRRILIFGDSMTHPGLDDSPRDVTVTSSDVGRSSSPGDLLGSWLLLYGASAVTLNAKVGRSATSFFSSTESDHDEVLANLQAWAPDLVFVFLGTNDLGYGHGDAVAMARIRDAFASQAEVWAIGPPSFADSVYLCDQYECTSRNSSGKCLTSRCVAPTTTYNSAAPATVAMMQSVFGADHFLDARGITADLLTPAQGRAGDLVHFAAAGARVFAARLAALLVVESIVSSASSVAAVMAPLTPAFAAVMAVGLGDATSDALTTVEEAQQRVAGLPADGAFTGLLDREVVAIQYLCSLTGMRPQDFLQAAYNGIFTSATDGLLQAARSALLAAGRGVLATTRPWGLKVLAVIGGVAVGVGAVVAIVLSGTKPVYRRPSSPSFQPRETAHW